MSIRRAIIRASDAADTVLRWATVGFLTALVGLVVLQVVARYVFASPPAWTEEMARYAMIWAGLLGATLSFKRGFDPALFAPRDGHGRLRAWLGSLSRSLPVLVYLLPILFFCVVGANMSVERSFLVRQGRMMASTVDVPLLMVGIAVPIMILTILLHLLARWCGDGAEPPESGGMDVG